MGAERRNKVMIRRGVTTACLALCLVLAAACSRQSGHQQSAASARNGVFGDQIKAMDKAKQVQKVLQDSAAAQRKAIEQQSR
jgi:aspartyl/asparaginyl beta-hydroxylase (cupin superfamily)